MTVNGRQAAKANHDMACCMGLRLRERKIRKRERSKGEMGIWVTFQFSHTPCGCTRIEMCVRVCGTFKAATTEIKTQ